MATKTSKKSTKNEVAEVKPARKNRAAKALERLAEASSKKSTKKSTKESTKEKEKSSEGKMTSTQQGHAIQKMMQASPYTVKQLCEKLGLTESRVKSHVAYEVSKGRASVDSKNRVIVKAEKQPRYRNEA